MDNFAVSLQTAHTPTVKSFLSSMAGSGWYAIEDYQGALTTWWVAFSNKRPAVVAPAVERAPLAEGKKQELLRILEQWPLARVERGMALAALLPRRAPAPPKKDAKEASRAHRRAYENARYLGIAPPRLKTTGMTIEEKIAFVTQPGPNGCRLYTGKAVTPEFSLFAKRIPIRKFLWERKHGPLAPGETATVNCGNSRCTAEEHIQILTKGELLHTKAAIAKAKGPTRLANSSEKYLNRYLPDILAAIPRVRRKFAWVRGKGIDLEDMLQEVALRVWREWAEKAHDIANVEALMTLSVKNLIRDTTRTYEFNNVESLDAEGAEGSTKYLEAFGTDPALIYERELIAYRARKRIHAHMRKLTPAVRKALYLQADGLSQKEIARILEKSENTIEQQLVTARKNVRSRKATAAQNLL